MTGQSVIERLRADILSGEFVQGQRLTEDQLSERYGVSRIPVREALTMLQGEGYVDRARFKYTTVAVLDQDEANGLFEVRAALEEAAVRRAGALGDADWTDVQDVLVRGLRIARDADDDPATELELARLDHELHELLIEASRSSVIIGLHHQIRDKIRWVYAAGVNHRSAESWLEHQQIVGSLITGETDRAAVLLREHIMRAADYHHYRSAPSGNR